MSTEPPAADEITPSPQQPAGRRGRYAAIIVIALALALGACGDDDADTTTATTLSTQTSTDDGGIDARKVAKAGASFLTVRRLLNNRNEKIGRTGS